MPNVEGAAPKRCFVVMGYGVETDLATGRKLDLNKSYRLLIKPVVEEKGMVCVRSDEIRRSGVIDVQMYQELLTADVVVADLSTANPNALYELGIRHALRPYTTVVVSEDRLPYPFDVNHVVINSYTHLGDAIDYDEVVRFRQELGKTLDAVLAEQQTDSPVYTFLQQLTPPALRGSPELARAGEALEQATEALAHAAADARNAEPDPHDDSLATLIEEGEQAIAEGRFQDAKEHFFEALHCCKSGNRRGGKDDRRLLPGNSYLTQRLVLATYKSQHPDPVSALNEALKLLAPLNPAESNDPETVGLAGAIEKRLFELGEGDVHLARAIAWYQRGYMLRADGYNGINLAYLLNLRADTPLDATRQERIADLVWANRVRRHVLEVCERDLQAIHQRDERPAEDACELQRDQAARDRERKFWALATSAEAFFGMGRMAEYEQTRAAAEAVTPAAWMMETFDGQIAKLRALLEKHGHLLDPPWPGAAAPAGAAG